MASQNQTSLIIEGDASGGMIIKAAPALKQAQQALNQAAQDTQAQLEQLGQHLKADAVELSTRRISETLNQTDRALDVLSQRLSLSGQEVAVFKRTLSQGASDAASALKQLGQNYRQDDHQPWRQSMETIVSRTGDQLVQREAKVLSARLGQWGQSLDQVLSKLELPSEVKSIGQTSSQQLIAVMQQAVQQAAAGETPHMQAAIEAIGRQSLESLKTLGQQAISQQVDRGRQEASQAITQQLSQMSLPGQTGEVLQNRSSQLLKVLNQGAQDALQGRLVHLGDELNDIKDGLLGDLKSEAQSVSIEVVDETLDRVHGDISKKLSELSLPGQTGEVLQNRSSQLIKVLNQGAQDALQGRSVHLGDELNDIKDGLLGGLKSEAQSVSIEVVDETLDRVHGDISKKLSELSLPGQTGEVLQNRSSQLLKVLNQGAQDALQGRSVHLGDELNDIKDGLLGDLKSEAQSVSIEVVDETLDRVHGDISKKLSELSLPGQTGEVLQNRSSQLLKVLNQGAQDALQGRSVHLGDELNDIKDGLLGDLKSEAQSVSIEVVDETLDRVHGDISKKLSELSLPGQTGEVLQNRSSQLIKVLNQGAQDALQGHSVHLGDQVKAIKEGLLDDLADEGRQIAGNVAGQALEHTHQWLDNQVVDLALPEETTQLLTDAVDRLAEMAHQTADDLVAGKHVDVLPMLRSWGEETAQQAKQQAVNGASQLIQDVLSDNTAALSQWLGQTGLPNASSASLERVMTQASGEISTAVQTLAQNYLAGEHTHFGRDLKSIATGSLDGVLKGQIELLTVSLGDLSGVAEQLAHSLGVNPEKMQGVEHVLQQGTQALDQTLKQWSSALVSGQTIHFGDDLKDVVKTTGQQLVSEGIKMLTDSLLGKKPQVAPMTLAAKVDAGSQQNIKGLEQELKGLNAQTQASTQSTTQLTQQAGQLAQSLSDVVPASKQASSAFDQFVNASTDRLGLFASDVFTEWFEEGSLGFDDLMDHVESSFKSTMASLASELTSSTLMNVMGGGGTQSGGFDLSSLVGIISGNSGGGSSGGLNIVDMISGGKKVYDYFFGDAAASAAGASTSAGAAANASGGSAVAQSGAAGGAGSSIASGLGTAAAGYAGQWVGGQLGQGITGKHANSNIGASVGTAAGAYIGSIVPVIGTYLGSALGGAIGSFVDVLGGSGRKAGVRFHQLPDDPAKTGYRMGYDTDPDTGYAWYSSGGWDDNNLGRGRTSAFGTYGYLSKDIFEPEDLANFLDGLKMLDDSVSQFLDESETANIKDDLTGYYYLGKDLTDIVDDRLTIMFKNIDTEFDQELKGLALSGGKTITEGMQKAYDLISKEKLASGNFNIDEGLFATALIDALQIESLGEQMGDAVAEDMFSRFSESLAKSKNTEQLDASANAITVVANTILSLNESVKTLNFTFDDTSENAYEAAEAINQAMGGLGNLQAAQTAYYQNYFSEEERRNNTFESLKTSLTEYFDALDVSMPQSATAFRELVESLDATTDSGSEAYVALMQIQGQAAQYYQLLAQQQQVTEQQRIQAEQQRIAAFKLPDSMSRYLQDVNRWASQELENINERMAALKEELRLGKALRRYVQDLNISERSPAGPGEKLSDSQAQFVQLLVAAEHGDMKAAGQLQQSANTYLDQADDYYGRSQAYSSIFNEVSGALDQLGFELINGHESEEQINQKMLYEQRQVRSYVAQELEWAQRQYGELANVSALLDRLPDALSSSLSALLPDNDKSERPSGDHSNSDDSKPSIPSRGSVVEQQVKALYQQYGQEYNQEAEYWTSGIKDGTRTLDQLDFQLWIDQAQSSQNGKQISGNIREAYQSAGMPIDEDGFNYWFSEIFNGNANFDDLQYGLLQDSKAKLEDYIRELAATYVRSSELNYQVDWWSDRLESGEGYQSVIRDIIAALNRSNDFEWVKAREYWESRGGVPGVNGSHRNGLASVPFDGYRAELHQAEMVLPAPLANHVRNSVSQPSVNIQPMVALLQSLQGEVSRLTQLVGASADQAGRQREQQIQATQQAARHTRPTPVTVG